jgi:L-ascorbate metabolism protein UlaG (beta-lactamase superfamily)
MSLTYRWLGVAGLEFSFQGFTLLIDPFFSRPGKAAVLVGQRIKANHELIARHVSHADAVLVTHPHYDHLLDVPEVMRRTGAPAYGSPNTSVLLGLHGIPQEKVTIIRVGDRFELGPFTIEVFPSHHTRIPFARWFNGPLPTHLHRKPARLPLRLSDYRMDACYSFNIHVDGLVMQIGKHPTPAEVLFISPYSGDAPLEVTLHAVRPKWVVPIHWDDFMRPLSRPLRPMLMTPAQGLRSFGSLIRRLDLKDFTCAVQQALPEAEVRIPEIFEPYHF